ncbi:hypothetical protein CC78DRAFT_580593 [Lojkania enalia]|uniref:Conserved oligomeric Golgi complex subunit 1 n=1 Tax=Lojkania enalia TaxID=147567 RepID=A0A9P4KDV7_9PLEO|nr:hypothetical protein CC78DRAFT_580593 [Didymosphaeria enalia]
MATEAPDPRTFKSWEDAFQYPIPVVRKLEGQLRSNAGENREKLRSLVGASYRDLLDTAGTIIDMEARMEQVEAKLAKIGQNCNSRGLDRTSSNAVKMDIYNRSRDLERYTFASQLSVLRNCPIVTSRLIRGEGSYLLIAKVLVISRFIHTGLSQSKHKPPMVDKLRDKLGTLRQKLLRRIDRQLASTAGDSTTLVESMCAYSLATSSTPTEVLQHFHRVRKEEIIKSLRHNEGLSKHGVDALKLCIQTCQDTQTIFPRRLADSLSKLKAQPLVQDPDVRALHELNLDIHDRWIGDKARNYTPQPRHDELQKSEAERILDQWSKQAISAFLKSIKAALEQTEDLKAVASLRQEVIETWILSGARMTGVKSANVLDDLRDAMNNQLEKIVRNRTQSLRTIVSTLSETLQAASLTPEEATMSLWSTTSTSIDRSNGAESFKSIILNTHQGRDGKVVRVVSTYDKWIESVLEVKGIIKTMKETRWDDTFADDVEDSDDGFGESKQTLLSDDDPRLLEEVTQGALSEALLSLGKSFAQIVNRSISDQGDRSVSQATFILRVVREIIDRVPRLRLQDKSTPLATPFTSDILKPLHATIAESTVHPAIRTYEKTAASAIKAASKSQILWEGNPPLPTQPSPSAFRFLQVLNKSMASHGSDLWSPAGVQVLKALSREEVSKIWQDLFDNMIATAEVANQSGASEQRSDVKAADDSSKSEEGAEKSKHPSNAEELRAQKLIQLLFDILYIERYLSTTNKSSTNHIVQMMHAASRIDKKMFSRLNEKAADYARKTYLLFALLA